MEPFYLCNSEIFGLSGATAVIYNFLCKVNNVSTVSRAIKALNKAGLIGIQQQTRKELFGNNGTSVNLYSVKSPVPTQNQDMDIKQ